MDKLIKRLPLFAFVLAAFAALAFNFPEKEGTSEYGKHGGNVYDVTNVDMGPEEDEYQCNTLSGQCLYSNSGATEPILDSVGEFDPGAALIPIPN